MPLRIVIAGAIAICACVIVPVSVNAVSSQDGTGDSVEDGEPPEPYSSRPSAAPAFSAERAAGGIIGGTDIHEAGSQMSWMTLVVVIALGFLPSVLMIIRSSQRPRAGPMS